STATPCWSRRSTRRSCSVIPARTTSAWPGTTSSSPSESTTRAGHAEPVIADVAFDAPVEHPFSYRIPDGWPLRAGQRVWAPLAGARRLGMVVAVREGDARPLKAVLAVADETPALSATGLALVRWIAAESLSSVGSSSAALLPPAVDDAERPHAPVAVPANHADS